MHHHNVLFKYALESNRIFGLNAPDTSYQSLGVPLPFTIETFTMIDTPFNARGHHLPDFSKDAWLDAVAQVAARRRVLTRRFGRKLMRSL